jgi:Actin-like ATPase involved in cell morphogenesis
MDAQRLKDNFDHVAGQGDAVALFFYSDLFVRNPHLRDMFPGGGSLLKNLDKLLREETSLPVSVAEDPLSSVVLGTGKMLSDFDLLRKISLD